MPIEGEAIENELIYGSLSGKKSNEDLGGALIDIFKTGTTEYTKENAIATADGKLDKKDKLLGEMGEVEKGVYQMNGLRYGKYLVREKTAPAGFVLDENVYPVSIEENGKTYNVENEAGKGFSFRVIGKDYDQTLLCRTFLHVEKSDFDTISL